MQDLSVVIVAKDEERTIGDVLSSVKEIAGEVVFVDSGSTDSTLEIVKAYGITPCHQDWLGYAAQKNFAIERARADWILSLDADEVVTAELAAEIKALLASPLLDQYDGYEIPRVLYIGDTAVMHGGFYPDAQLRLFKRGRGKFNDRLVHEAVKVPGSVGRLRHAMKHYAYATVADFNAAMEKYARLSAQEFVKQGKNGWRTHPLNELLHPLWTMFYRYVIRGGFIDGALGWQLNCLYSDYVRRKIRYQREQLPRES